MKKYILTLLSCLIFVGCSSSIPSTKVHIGPQSFLCEVANNDDTRAQGLMFRNHLNSDAGMLFDLETEKKTAFWMKNTLIPLDIIWIDKARHVISMETATPCTTKICDVYSVDVPARWVLEVNAGTFHGKTGDRVEFAL